jgi:hypothetical protein
MTAGGRDNRRMEVVALRLLEDPYETLREARLDWRPLPILVGPPVA